MDSGNHRFWKEYYGGAGQNTSKEGRKRPKEILLDSPRSPAIYFHLDMSLSLL